MNEYSSTKVAAERESVRHQKIENQFQGVWTCRIDLMIASITFIYFVISVALYTNYREKMLKHTISLCRATI